MNSLYTFGVAVVVAAGVVIVTDDLRRKSGETFPNSFEATTAVPVATAAPKVAVVPAPSGQPQQQAQTAPDAEEEPKIAAAMVRVDQPPFALMCREETAELRLASNPTPLSDFLDEFILVSDPSEACRDPNVSARGGLDADSGRCYTMRPLGTSDANLPMVCSERTSTGADGTAFRKVECSGWNRRIETAADGGFQLTFAGPGEQTTRRVSAGMCQSL